LISSLICSALTRTQTRIEGLDPTIWDEDDYAILDEAKVGRIYSQRIYGEPKWVWCLQTEPCTASEPRHSRHAR